MFQWTNLEHESLTIDLRLACSEHQVLASYQCLRIIEIPTVVIGIKERVASLEKGAKQVFDI